MNITQEKMSKTSKLISTILATASALVALAAVLFAIAIGILIFANNTTVISLQKAFTILSLAGSVEIPSVQNLVILFLLSIVQLKILFFLFYLLHRIFKNISIKYTPFEQEQVKRLKQVSFLTFMMCVASTITEIMGSLLLYGTLAFRLDIMWFVLAVVIYCLAYIFDYGTQLQKQSDETL